uniref:Uncharacterized protein n=1 Tax=Daphnia galeata TaxID=27404 RepID=A0A8J2WRL6_9CRUS|nr:unnamed protein product [Daphnia galeata]
MMVFSKHGVEPARNPLTLDCRRHLRVVYNESRTRLLDFPKANFPSFSDHPYIYFEINRSPSACGNAHAQSRASTATPHISRICLDKFRLRVADDVKNLVLQTNPTTSTIDDLIVKLSALISSASKSSKDPIYIPFSSRSTPWWTKELWVLRHKSRQAFKLWSVQRTESNRQAFKAHKATYQREIRTAKLSSWNKLCDSQPSSSDLFSALKTKSGKSANVSLPSSNSIDGSVSSNPTDILKKCAEHFFPSPTPSTQAHAQAEELAASPSKYLAGQNQFFPGIFHQF